MAMIDTIVKTIQAIARCRPLLYALVLVFSVMSILAGFCWNHIDAVEDKVDAVEDKTDANSKANTSIEAKLDLLIEMQGGAP